MGNQVPQSEAVIDHLVELETMYPGTTFFPFPCGPRITFAALHYRGVASASLDELSAELNVDPNTGACSLADIKGALDRRGLDTDAVKGPLDQVVSDVDSGFIILAATRGFARSDRAEAEAGGHFLALIKQEHSIRAIDPPFTVSIPSQADLAKLDQSVGFKQVALVVKPETSVSANEAIGNWGSLAIGVIVAACLVSVFLRHKRPEPKHT